jgi:NADH:ubiquinone oxidoreductase subunit 4 (subunit M)
VESRDVERIDTGHFVVIEVDGQNTQQHHDAAHQRKEEELDRRVQPIVGAQYLVGVDGFSSLLILLATLMGLIAILSSWTAITMRVKEYYIFLLVLQTGMIGAFVSLDFLLFFLFWEVMLVPMYFLIGIWGSDNRLYSAIKFFLFTLVGSVVMLLGILAVYFYHHEVTGIYSFDITRFHQLNMPFDLQWWVFLAFFLASGSQVWNGNIGTLTANPRKNARKTHHCRSNGMFSWWNRVMSNE